MRAFDYGSSHRDWLWVVVAVLGASVLRVLAGAPAQGLRVVDLENRLVDPFRASSDVRAIVFVFTSVDCPISNRYAPEVRRLYDTFGSKGVRFSLVYPNPAESPEAIRSHLKAYAYPMRALRDPQHALVKLVKATVTPEAAVYDRGGTLVYRGRIDDRYVNLGLERQAPSRHDLADALAATLAGREVPHPTTEAVGCFIADFLR